MENEKPLYDSLISMDDYVYMDVFGNTTFDDAKSRRLLKEIIVTNCKSHFEFFTYSDYERILDYLDLSDNDIFIQKLSGYDKKCMDQVEMFFSLEIGVMGLWNSEEDMI